MNSKIILNSEEQIACPHCEKQFLLRDALTHQLIDRYETEYESLLSQERASLQRSISKELERTQAREFEVKLAELKEQLEDSQSKAVNLEGARTKAVEAARAEALQEAKVLQEELAEKDKNLPNFVMLSWRYVNSRNIWKNNKLIWSLI